MPRIHFTKADPNVEAAGIANVQLVGGGDNSVVVIMPRQRMTRREALVHAAWLVAVAEGLDGQLEDTSTEFASILAAVRNT